MKFFVPKIDDKTERDRMYEAIRRFASESLGWEFRSRRVFSLRYRHKRVEALAQVGELDIDGETILAIFESVTYVVCTPNRGAFRGDPILVGKDEVSSVEYFEEEVAPNA
jgi:hypothetical protein